MFSRLLYRSTGHKSCGLAQELITLLPRYFSEAIVTFKPKLTHRLHFTRNASLFSVSKIQVSNLRIHKQSEEIFCKAHPKSLTFVRQSATATFGVKTNVANNVFLYKYDRPRYFKFLNGFGGFQLLVWWGISYVLCMQLPSCDLSQDSLNKYLSNNFLTIVFLAFAALVGTGSTILIWLFTAKSVRYLILHKGGKSVSFITYHPLNKNVTTTVPIDRVKCKVARQEMKTYMSLKLEGGKFYYILDSDGEFVNPTLFDCTIGMNI